MAFGDYELIHTKRVNRDRQGRNVYRRRVFEAMGGYTALWFGFSFALIGQQLSGTPCSAIIPGRSFITRAGFKTYMKSAGLFVLLPFYIGHGIGICNAGDYKELNQLVFNSLVYEPEMHEYKKEIYYS